MNLSVRRDALEKLERAVEKHDEVRNYATQAIQELHSQRQRAVSEVIDRVNGYVDKLANTPKDIGQTVEQYRADADRFESEVKQLEIEAAQSTTAGSATSAAGIATGAGVAATGVGVATLGPSAAVAVATTFGTASTGTAISALSGAAATNAELAWLGGGALAAGGGGMAAGNALLALAGPVGWSVAGVGLLGSAAFLRSRNKKRAKQATQKRTELEAQIRALRAATVEIRELQASFVRHADSCLLDLFWLEKQAPRDYREFGKIEKERLLELVGHVRSLGMLLGSKVTYGYV